MRTKIKSWWDTSSKLLERSSSCWFLLPDFCLSRAKKVYKAQLFTIIASFSERPTFQIENIFREAFTESIFDEAFLFEFLKGITHPRCAENNIATAQSDVKWGLGKWYFRLSKLWCWPLPFCRENRPCETFYSQSPQRRYSFFFSLHSLLHVFLAAMAIDYIFPVFLLFARLAYTCLRIRAKFNLVLCSIDGRNVDTSWNFIHRGTFRTKKRSTENPTRVKSKRAEFDWINWAEFQLRWWNFRNFCYFRAIGVTFWLLFTLCALITDISTLELLILF